MIVSHVLDGAKIQTRIDDKFVIDSDQPNPWGEDTAPAPYDIFLTGVAACTAYFAQRYCRKWNLPHDGIRVELEPVFNAAHQLTDIKLRVRVPSSFPKDHVAGLLRNAGACPVKKALETSPAISLEAVEG
ncbi:MAG TPA: OsmC family protein [Rhodocyclaceae bacterium]|nr:OsmC family protein [Rhodocyclaceae bacterium]